MSFPTVAGLSTYEEAAKPGYSVEQTVQLLVRYAWIKKRMMETSLYWINPTPEWEIKEGLSFHLYQDAEHAQLIRTRVAEMRNPPPNMNASPADRLDRLFDELLASKDTLERITGLYGLLRVKLLEALRDHYNGANPLAEHPTRRILRIIIMEEEDAVAWGKAVLDVLRQNAEEKARSDTWLTHLAAYLNAAGWITGERALPSELPAPRASGLFKPDYFPARDERFLQRWNFQFPPHEVYRAEGVSVDEKTLALMCKRALEMDVPEAMAWMIGEAGDRPWEYYVDMCRQLWDEARHAMMGEVYFEKHGIDWKKEVPLHTGFSIQLTQYMSPIEAHCVLYTIEQGLMPAATGKRYEFETAVEASDELAALFQDYDWADEVLHTQIGRRWLLKGQNMTREEAVRIGTQKFTEEQSVLLMYTERGEQENWWPAFVKKVLGKESAMQFGAESATEAPVSG